MPNKRKIDFTNSLVTPIYQTATYFYKDTSQAVRHHNKEIKLGRYGRYDNPSWLEVERRIADLDGFEEALIFPSGMNAIVTAIFSFVTQGDNILFTGKGYRNIRTFFTSILTNYGIDAVPISPSNIDLFHDEFERYYNEKTKIVFIEAPSNPHLYLADLEKIRGKMSKNALLIVDSTFASPMNFQPKYFGADLVIHSCSKYLGGHADIIAGSVAGSSELIDRIRLFRNNMGGIVDPHCAFLLNRSLDTYN